MEGKSMGNAIIIAERAAASPGEAQKSMLMSVWVEEEEVIRQIQTPNLTTNTSNTDTARLDYTKNYDCSQLMPHNCNFK